MASSQLSKRTSFDLEDITTPPSPPKDTLSTPLPVLAQDNTHNFLKAARKRIAELETEIDDLRSSDYHDRLTRAEKEMHNLAEESSNWKEKYCAIADGPELGDLRLAIDIERQARSKAEAALRTSKIQNDQYHSWYKEEKLVSAEFARELGEVREREDQLTIELESSQTLWDAENDGLRDEVTKQSGEIGQLGEQVAALLSQLQTRPTQEQVKSAQQKYDDLQTERDHHHASNTALRGELAYLRATKEGLEANISELQTSHQSQFDHQDVTAKEKIEETEREQFALISRNSALEQRNRELEDILAKTESRSDELKSMYETKITEMQTLAQEANSSSAAEKHQLIEAHQASLWELGNQLTESRSKQQMELQQTNPSSSENEELKTLLQNSQAAYLAEKETLLANHEAAMKTLEANTTTTLAADRKSSVEGLEQKFRWRTEELEQTIWAHEDNLEHLRYMCTEGDRRERQLKEKLQKKEEEMITLDSRLQHFQRNLDSQKLRGDKLEVLLQDSRDFQRGLKTTVTALEEKIKTHKQQVKNSRKSGVQRSALPAGQARSPTHQSKACEVQSSSSFLWNILWFVLLMFLTSAAVGGLVLVHKTNNHLRLIQQQSGLMPGMDLRTEGGLESGRTILETVLLWL